MNTLDRRPLVDLEHVVRRSGLAVRVIDLVTGAPVTDAVAEAWRADRPAERIGGERHGSIVGFRALPGLRSYEDGSTSRDDWFASPPVHARLPFVMRVRDAGAEHMPVLRTILLPAPAPVVVTMPTAATARAPVGYSLVTGQLVAADGGPAAWALVQVSLGPVVIGGVSDGRGMFAIPVPLTETPSSTGTPATGSTWNVTVAVRYKPDGLDRAVGSDPDDPPTLISIFTQPAATVDAAGSVVSSIAGDVGIDRPFVVSSAAPPAPQLVVVHPAP